MKTKTPRLGWFTLCLILFFHCVWVSRAIPSGSASDNGNGTWTYAYEVDNTGGSFDIIAWTLEFNFSSGLIDWNQADVLGGGDVTVSANWIAQAGVPTIGQSAQDFFSLDSSSDVLAGASLTGFSFVSALAPGVITYYLEFGAGGESVSGFTVGPTVTAFAAVPEGGSNLFYGLISIIFCFGLNRYLTVNGQPKSH